MGTVLYWLALVLWSAALAYLVLFRAFPYLTRRMYAFGTNVGHALNAEPEMWNARTAFAASAASVPPPLPIPHDPEDDHLVTAHYSDNVEPIANVEPIRNVEPIFPPAPAGVGQGFFISGGKGAVTVDDIVKGLAREPYVSAARQNAPAPVREAAPMAPRMVPQAGARRDVPTDVRGFVAALVEGDREAVFATLRNVVRGGGNPEHFITDAVCALDDAYRARIDGSPADPEVARISAHLETPRLERLIGALATAVDSSYSAGATGAKLALTRALAVITG
jgi:hypothetical protein